MKRIIWWSWLGAVVLLAAYSAGAWWMMRGAGAYRMGTGIGGALAASWQFTALGAALLGIPLLIRLGWMIRRKRRPAAQAAEPAKPGRKKRGKEEPAPTEKLAPASPEDETILLTDEKIAPASPEDAMVLLEEESIAPAAPEGGRIPPAPPQDATVLLTEEPPAPVEEPVPPAPPAEPIAPSAEPALPANPCCPRCGAAGKPGQKFCTKCGAPMGGGAA